MIFIVTDLGYGDSGKGTVTDWLVRKYNLKLVVRFSGGSQAAHYVISPEGKKHCFAQFGSGTMVPGVETFLSSRMLVDPLALDEEFRALNRKNFFDAYNRLSIDSGCPVITPVHRIMNRIRETARGNERHGSCGMGIGEAVADKDWLGDLILCFGELYNPKLTAGKLEYLWSSKMDIVDQILSENPGNEELGLLVKELTRFNPQVTAQKYLEILQTRRIRIRDAEYLCRMLNEDTGAVFEGSQGVLLDERYGFDPYTTPTSVVSKNAEEIIKASGFASDVVKIGVLRGYATRHGPGPFVTEDSELAKTIEPCDNKINDWQGGFRVGWLDIVSAKYAIKATGGIDRLFITNLDRLRKLPEIKLCGKYVYGGRESGSLNAYFETDEFGEFPGILNINFLENTNQKRQNELGGLLKNCKPVYREEDVFSTDDLESFLRRIEQELGVSITVVSFGPASIHKVERKNIATAAVVAKKKPAPRKVVIYGGSFNPPGNHHREIAQFLRMFFDQVIVVPCGIREDKESTNSVGPKHRGKMVEMAFGWIHGVWVDSFDLKDGGFTPSYLLEERYRKMFPKAEIWHFAGTDIIAGGSEGKSEIHRIWHKGEWVWNNLNFVINIRPGFAVRDEDFPPNSRIMEISELQGSSTEIRRLIKSGHYFFHKVPQNVGRYIDENWLYR